MPQISLCECFFLVVRLVTHLDNSKLRSFFYPPYWSSIVSASELAAHRDSCCCGSYPAPHSVQLLRVSTRNTLLYLCLLYRKTLKNQAFCRKNNSPFSVTFRHIVAIQLLTKCHSLRLLRCRIYRKHFVYNPVRARTKNICTAIYPVPSAVRQEQWCNPFPASRTYNSQH